MPHNATPPTIAPLLLRMALGVTFLWAGSGKLMSQEYTGPMAGTLASMNEGTILQGQWPPVAAAESDEDDDSATEHNTDTDPEATVEESGAESIETEPVAEGDDESDAATDTTVPADEPLTVRARRVMALAGMLKMSADGNDQRSRLIPKALGSDTWAKSLAWTAVATELAAGTALIFGLFSRLAALGVMGTMGTALWLTQIGPAVRTRTGDNFLGFLPKPEMASPEWTQVWNTMLWQLGLLAMAGAILCIGAGRLSLDAWVFGTRKTPKPAPRKPAYDAPRSDTPPSRPRRPDHPGEIELD